MRGRKPPRDRQEKRGLAGAIGAENPEHLAQLDHEADILEHDRVVAAHGQVVNCDDEGVMGNLAESGGGRDPRDPSSQEALRLQQQQDDQSLAIKKGVGVRKRRSQDQLVERGESERPEESAKRVEGASEHPQHQRQDGEGR